MSRTLRNIKLGLDESLAEHLAWMAPGMCDFRVLRQSVDARQRHSPHFVYSVEVFENGEKAERPAIEVQPVRFDDRPVVIVGAGPAGMFAALRLSERGIPCVLLEQGSVTEKRILSISKFWRRGDLDPRNNVGFGEGGAGLFSDGKLITRIKSEHIPYVMQRLVRFGAPPEIEFTANPHVGSDRIRKVIPLMREHLRTLGCELRFDTKVDEILTRGTTITGVRTNQGEVIACDRLILACGHSADGLFRHLHEIGVFLEGKSFAVGLRVEHPQNQINQIQYRELSGHPKLGAANYRLAYHNRDRNLGVYSFCMCPGGYVLSCSTDGAGVVTNGMSNFSRGSRFANSAIVVSIDFKQSFGDKLFGGLEFRAALEKAALDQVIAAGGSKQIPAQRLVDFTNGSSGPLLDSSSPSGVIATRLDELFSDDFKRLFLEGLRDFDRQMPGFVGEQALLHGVESRTSCPLRITRHEQTLQSVSHAGLYPAGEGAGYAGGITSAACDGIRIAEVIASDYNSMVASAAGSATSGAS